MYYGLALYEVSNGQTKTQIFVYNNEYNLSTNLYKKLIDINKLLLNNTDKKEFYHECINKIQEAYDGRHLILKSLPYNPFFDTENIKINKSNNVFLVATDYNTYYYMEYLNYSNNVFELSEF